jgi:hypothetical protein
MMFLLLLKERCKSPTPGGADTRFIRRDLNTTFMPGRLCRWQLRDERNRS